MDGEMTGDLFTEALYELVEESMRAQDGLAFPQYLFGAKAVLNEEDTAYMHNAGASVVLDAFHNAMHLVATSGLRMSNEVTLVLLAVVAPVALRAFGFGLAYPRRQRAANPDNAHSYFQGLRERMNRNEVLGVSSASNDVEETDNPFDQEV